ncbi:MAG: GNVR domain-containing protein [Cyanobacteria bacterium J06554_1]
MQHFFAIALRHWKPVAFLNILIIGFATHNILSVEETWTADAQVILPNTTRDLNLDLGEFGKLQGGQGLTFSSQLDSREILASIMTSTDAVRQAWESDPEHHLYDRLETYQKLFEVKTNAESTTISLVAEGSTPEVSQVRLNLFINAFQQRLRDLRADDVTQRTALIDQELAEVSKDLDLTGQALVTFQEQYGVVDSDEQTQTLIKSINTLSLTQGQVLADYQASSLRLENLVNRLNQTPEQAVLALQLSEDPGYQSIQAKLSALNVELLEAQSLFTDEHPQVAYLLTQQAKLVADQQAYIVQSTSGLPGVNTSAGQTYRALIQEMVLTESETYGLQKQASQLADQLEQLTSRLAQMPSVHVRLQALQREYDIAQEVYKSLLTQIETNRVDAFSTYPVVQVLDQPTASTRPSGPGKRPIVVGALLASLLGSTAIVLYLEQQNPLLTLADLYKTNLRPLGKIPNLKQLTPGELEPLTSSLAFQQLATVISKTLPVSACLMVSSAIPKEGKTTVALGLAIALSHLGFKVLLIKDETRNEPQSWSSDYPPRQIPNSPQIANPQPFASTTLQPGLDIASLESQPLSDNQICRFEAFGKLLHMAQHACNYDYILVDSAPLSTSSEANWLMAQISNLLLVVRPGMSYRHPFAESLEQLTQTQVNVLGVAVNGADR